VDDHAKERDPRLRRELLDLLRLVVVDPVDGRERAAQLAVDPREEALADEEQYSRGENADDQRQHPRVPQGEARPHAERRRAHSRLSPSTNPMPRIVCSSFFSNGSSILRRSRTIVTSMTLSSGVARAVTCHTC